MILATGSNNDDYDLTTLATVLTDTPNATYAMICQGLILLGDGAKDLDGTGGDFEFTITVGGQTIQPNPQIVEFDTAVRAAVWTAPFPVPANTEVIVKVKSPNAADTDVDVTGYLYDVGGFLSAKNAIVNYNLDHLLHTAVGDNSNMTTEVVDGSIVSNIMTRTGDTSDYDYDTDSLEAHGTHGPGDYAVTLTVRTTAGVAVASVVVWLNTANDRTGSVVKAGTTDDNGQVVFYLDYDTEYHIFCHLAGYSFAAASMTPAAGSVSFSKDIATAEAAPAGSAASYADSFITRAIDGPLGVRKVLDEPALNAKYSDDDLITAMESAYPALLNEINRNSQTPVVGRFTVTIAENVTEYILPHTVGSVYAVYEENSDTGARLFYDARDRLNPLGMGMDVEGNILKLQSTASVVVGTEIIVEYVPSGTARLHCGTCTLDTDGEVATFASAPYAGELDTHADAYVGSVLRILGCDGSNSYIQERIITAYDNTTREATLAIALNPIPTAGAGYIYYEIAPVIHQGLDAVIALYAAYRIALTNNNVKRSSALMRDLRAQIRNLRLNAYYSHVQKAPRARSDNYRNRRYLKM